MSVTPEPRARTSCPGCASQVGPGLLSCPCCHALLYADELRELAGAGEQAEEEGRTSEALAAWRAALELLPPRAKQYAVVASRIETLSSLPAARSPVDGEAAVAEEGGSWRKRGAGLAALGLLLWKFKFVLGFLATKGKLLVAGLGKSSTLLSMLLSLGVYWAAWGWMFALGLVLSIYVHEMGHVAMLRRYGIAASAPMFIPGLGAVIRMKQYPQTPAEDARVGLAGPVWGLAAALAAFVVYAAGGGEMWGAIARLGAWINLFNLLPVWQLDGSRAFAALTRGQRWLAVLALGAAWLLSGEGLLILLAIVAGARAAGRAEAKEPDIPVLVQYALLVGILTWLTQIEITLG